MKPKVLWIAFQSTNEANGGIESFTQILNSLTDVESVVVTQVETPRTESWRNGHLVELMNLPYQFGESLWKGGILSWMARFSSYLRTNIQIYRLIRKLSCIAAVSNDPAAFWHSFIGIRLAGVRNFLILRDTIPNNRRSDFRWKMASLFVDAVIVLSDEMRRFWALKFISATRVEVIPSIIELSRFQDARKIAPPTQFGMNELSPKIAYVGAICDKKNQYDFIKKTVPLLVNEFPNLKIYFLGDADPSSAYFQSCAKLVKDLELSSNAKFLGCQNNIENWYWSVQLTVLASRNEGLARSMIESLACGTPVVSFDVTSAIESLETPQCGLVAKQGDYISLARSIIKLLKEPELRATMGLRGSKYVQSRFQAAKVAELYQTLLLQASGSDATDDKLPVNGEA